MKGRKVGGRNWDKGREKMSMCKGSEVVKVLDGTTGHSQVDMNQVTGGQIT